MPTFFFNVVFELSIPPSHQPRNHPRSQDCATSFPQPDSNIFEDPLLAPTTQFIPSSPGATPQLCLERDLVPSSESEPPGDIPAPSGNLKGGNLSIEKVLQEHSICGKNSSGEEADRGSAPCASGDWRFDIVFIESINMLPRRAEPGAPHAGAVDKFGARAHLAASEVSIKGKFIPSQPLRSDLGSGVVHLYRDRAPSPILNDYYDDAGSEASANGDGDERSYIDRNGTTLCIIAVPSYMTPSDLLGWVGEDAREDISHLRLVRTARSNKYMALLKFRESEKAKQWQKAWNGKLFSTMEPENCHVVFIRSIRFQVQDSDVRSSSFPDMANDPFTPASNRASKPALQGPVIETNSRSATPTTLTPKPAPPPTPSLVELPTCPVCLERMDNTNGLATIFCQHVFHCACLQKWKGSGCPVCRYTQDDLTSRAKSGKSEGEPSECKVCGLTQNLWICLICGHLGCGRYDEAHASDHFKQTSHAFAMDIATQHIWDYVSDEYVHRLIQDKSDGKLVELPSSTASRGTEIESEPVPQDKLENMSVEYTHLLTSQLDSQRLYFEEQVERAVDKAAKATSAAEQAAENAVKAASRLDALQESNHRITSDTLPSMERDKDRSEKRAERFETMARKMEKEWREKEVINESLMDRIAHLEKQMHDLTLRNSDLEEQNRDLSFFISGTEKLKDRGEEVQEGSVSVPDPPPTSKKKKKGGGRG